MSLFTLTEVDRRLVELAASKELGDFTPMFNALAASKTKADPVFVKRGSSILVMEREQFNEIQQAIGGT